ncbi:glutamine amidotransferase [Flexibacterium corallicola]|uniref:glutamine amidotransferase n=1 Tax=Flexibacterium corallicola TaxID=3037259 RepID=UPI00286EE3CE|nr:glutamine amidotransferase [Pseudovibrio sp. M1P-2-3]
MQAKPPLKTVDAPKVLIILHQEGSTPGRVGHELVKRGFQLDMRRPRFGSPLPETMEDHAGAIIFGGPQSANDTDPYILRETEWIKVPLAENKPYLGICLGAQMLARHLGGTVQPNGKGRVEIGYYPIEPTQAGKNFMQWPSKVYQWHQEGFSLPSSAELLASGPGDFPNQAFRFGEKGFGIQFHPELTQAMMHRWTTKASERMKDPGAQSRHDHFSGREIFEPRVQQWLRDFLDLWIGYPHGQQEVPKERTSI